MGISTNQISQFSFQEVSNFPAGTLRNNFTLFLPENITQAGNIVGAQIRVYVETGQPADIASVNAEIRPNGGTGNIYALGEFQKQKDLKTYAEGLNVQPYTAQAIITVAVNLVNPMAALAQTRIDVTLFLTKNSKANWIPLELAQLDDSE